MKPIRSSLPFPFAQTVRLLFAAVFLGSALSTAHAQTSWTASTGDWFTAGNWDNGVPASGVHTIIGNGGTAQISTGGAAEAGTLNVGANGSTDGTVTITNGSLTITQLVIAGGGNLGTVTLDGATASLTIGAGGSSSVGSAGARTGTLNIRNGATMTMTTAGVPFRVGSLATGIMTVEGSGSTFSTPGGANAIGNAATGTLTVKDGGSVSFTTPTGVTLGSQAAGRGTLNIEGTAGSRGAFEVHLLSEGSGTGAINFDGGILRALASTDLLQNFESGDVTLNSGGGFIDSNGFNISISAILGGTGTLTKQGAGRLTLSAANTYSGSTTVEAGTLRIVTDALGDGVTLQNSAILEFTDAAQSLSTTTYSQGANNRLSLALAGTGAGEFNRIVTTGAATLGGTLTITLDGSFTPQNGDSFDLFDFDSITGTFATVNLPALGAHLAWDITALYSTGVIQVIFLDYATADDQSISTLENTPVNITLTGTGEPLPLSYAIDDPPANGDLTGTPPNVTYTPDPGFLGEDSFTFTVSAGTATSSPATVTVTVNAEIPAQGTYTGLVFGSDFADSGEFVLTVSKFTSVSGKLTYAGKTYSFKGQFDGGDELVVEIKRKNLPPLELTLHRELVDGADVITGTVFDGTNTSLLEGGREIYNAKTNPCPFEGTYTMLIAPGCGCDSPGGAGSASVIVAASGKAQASGYLGDGTRFTVSRSITRGGIWPFSKLAYGQQGSFSAEIIFGDCGCSDFFGEAIWFKPASPKDTYYPDGFSIATIVEGSFYQPPLFPQRVLDLLNVAGNAEIAFFEGNLDDPFGHLLTVDQNQKTTVLVPDEDKLSVSVTAKEGRISGTFIHPANGKKVKFYGIVDQAYQLGAGMFFGVDETGGFEFSANCQFGEGLVPGDGSKTLPKVAFSAPPKNAKFSPDTVAVPITGTAKARTNGSTIAKVQYQVLAPDGTISDVFDASGTDNWVFTLTLLDGPGTYTVFVKAIETGTDNESSLYSRSFTLLEPPAP